MAAANSMSVEIRADIANISTGIKQVKDQLSQFSAQAGLQFSTAQRHADAFGGSVRGAAFQVAGMAAAMQGFRSLVQQVADAGMQMDKVRRTLDFATGNGDQGLAFARKTSRELGLELVSTAQAYGKLAAAARGTSLEGQKSRDIFKAVASASSVMGLSAEETSGALLAIGQMISKGKVQAEELRGQLGERLPGAFQIAARAMGKTTQELDKLLEGGKLLAEDFLPKFASQIQKELGDAPSKSADTFQGSMNRLKNAWTDLLNGIAQQGAVQGAGSAMTSLAEAMEKAAGNGVARDLGQSLSQLAQLAGLLAKGLLQVRGLVLDLAKAYAVWVGGKALQWVVELVQSKLKLVAASQATAAAQVAEALALRGVTASTREYNLAAVQYQLSLVESELASKRAGLTATSMATADRTAALAALERQRAELLKAQSILTATSAQRAFGAASAMLGGPLGIVTLALSAGVAAWSMYARKAQEAAARAEESARKQKEATQNWVSVSQEAIRLEEERNKAKAGSAEWVALDKQLILTKERLLEIYPDLLFYLKNEADGQRSLSDAIRMTRDERIKDLEAQAAGQKVTAAAMQQEIDRRKQWNDYGKNQAQTITTMEDGKLQSRTINTADRSIHFNEGEIRKAEEIRDRAERLVKEAQDQLAILNGAKVDENRSRASSGSASGTTKDLITHDEARVFVQERLAKSLSKTTLAEEEQASIQQIRADRQKDLVKLEDDLAKGKFKRAGGEADYAQMRAAIWIESSRRILQVEQKTATEREKLQEDLLSKMESKDEDAETRRLAAVEKTFREIREMNQKLQQDGKPFLTDEQILRQEDAAKTMARAEAVRDELRKLREELSQTANTLGRGLTPDEKGEVLGRYRKRGGAAGKAAETVNAEDNRMNDYRQGLQSYLTDSKKALKEWGTYAKNVMQGVENAFAQGLEGILSGQMSLSQGLKSIWKGLVNTIIGLLAELAAKFLVTAIAQAIFGKASQETAAKDAVANQISAASKIWNTYASIPYVGPALAAGFTAMMQLDLMKNAAAAGAMGTVAGAAEGGWFDRPTLTMIGEGRRPELVVPDVAFKDFATNLASNILAQERVARGHQTQAASYSKSAGRAAASGGGSRMELHQHFNAPILDMTGRGKQQLAEIMYEASGYTDALSNFRMRPDVRQKG